MRLHSLLVLLLLCVLLMLIGGCLGGGLDKEFVRAVDKNWNVIGPDYKQYLDADEALSERSKSIRLRAVAEFTLLVKEAKAEFEDGNGNGGGP